MNIIWHVIYITGEEGRLKIEKVGREDAGMYQCLVRDEDISMQATLQLILGGKIYSLYIHIFIFPC